MRVYMISKNGRPVFETTNSLEAHKWLRNHSLRTVVKRVYNEAGDTLKEVHYSTGYLFDTDTFVLTVKED